MSEKKSVLFVCTGNTCRSPMAAGLFHHEAHDHPEWSVGSAGVMASNGYPASHETLKALAKKDINWSHHQSRQIRREMIEQATDIFVMTAAHLEIIVSNIPEAADKTKLITAYTDNRDIDDPIGCGQQVYDEVANQLTEAIRAIMKQWESNEDLR